MNVSNWFANALCLLALGACTNEKIVFRDREPFNPPLDTQSGFLGYFTVDTKQTSCGNCHVGHQRDWKQTGHATAWSGLVASGAQQSYCNNCHSLSQLGNNVAGPAGYAKVADSAYFDVQCESCHGPGYAHVQVPDVRSNWPLARMFVDSTKWGCGGCHTGTHEPFTEEWGQSLHSQVITTAASRAECASCHDGKQTLVAWGVTTNYIEKSQPGYLPTTCAVCHNPHGSANEAELRFSITSPDPEQNLCMKCHLRRSEPVTGSAYGARPHAPQGAVLIGIAGYRPAGFTLDTNLIVSSHGSSANPNLCAGCHVNRFTYTDTASGDQFFSTGHLFRPVPCLDPTTGRPVADNSCAYTTTARSFKACAASGCHATEAVAASILGIERTRLKQLVDVVWADLDGDETIDAYPTDTGYLAKVKLNAPAEFAADSVITAAEGAEFNARLVGEGLYANGDKSLGVHNPFLAEALVRANISELQQKYSGFLPAPPLDVQRILTGPLGAVTKRPWAVVSRTATR